MQNMMQGGPSCAVVRTIMREVWGEGGILRDDSDE